MAQQSLSGALSHTPARAATRSPLDALIAYTAYATLAVALLFATFDKSLAGLKPGEVALVALTALVGLRRVLTRDLSYRTTPLDAGFLLLIAAGTFLPLITLEARGLYITKDIFRGLIGPVEYYLWYRVFLEAVPLPARLPQLTKVLLGSLSVVSLIGVLQIARFPGVEKALVKYYAGYNVDLSQYIHRATSVVGSWETLAAMAVYALLLINQLQTRRENVARLGSRWNLVLIAMALINAGAVASALSFAGFIGVALGYVIAWRLNGKLPRFTLVTLGVGALALLALAPYLAARLHAGGNTGLILKSWQDRALHWHIIYNVLTVNAQTLIVGVQPAFTYPVNTFNSTESMYLLLLYRGGVIYLLAFLAFLVLTFVTILRARRASAGFERELLTALLTIFIVHFVIDIVDAHLFDAGESQSLLTMLAMVGGLALRTDQPAVATERRAGGGQRTIPPGVSALGRGVFCLAALASVATAGLAWNYNRHQTPPPANLSAILYDESSATWLENQAIGTTTWQIDAGADTTFLQGYAGQVSALPGQTVNLYVSSPRAVAYSAQVYRIGWYRGEGGHLLATLSGLRSQVQGTWTAAAGLVNCATCVQDPRSHLLEAGWASDASVTIGANWLTGMYLIKLTSTDGVEAESYIPLVVKSDKPAVALLASIPMMSYAADNIWGGYSLDTHGTVDAGVSDPISPDRATAVSFNRPFVNSAGAGDFLDWEIHAVRWLERSAFPVDYTTDVDISAAGGTLNHRIYVSLGPDAYWTQSMRGTFVRSFQQSGTSLEFYSAKNGYWQARLANAADGTANRTVICYKVATGATDPTQALTLDPLAKTQPALTTARWADPILGLPENGIVGASYGGDLSPTAMPRWTVRASGALDQIETLQTGLTPGLQLKPGIIRYGFDGVPQIGAEPAAINTLSETAVTDATGRAATATSTFYFSAARILVFDAGVTSWDWSLDESAPPGANLTDTVLGDQHLATLTGNMLFTELPAPGPPPS